MISAVAAGDLADVLPAGWVPTVVDAENDIAAVASASLADGPVMVHASWARDEGSRVSSHQRDLPRIQPGGGHRLVMLLPAGDLDLHRTSRFREGLFLQWSPRLVGFITGALSSVHNRFNLALVVLEPRVGNQEPCAMFDAGAASQSEVDSLIAEASRLLKMKGGRTEHGYILRELPSGGEQLGFQRNDPRLAERRAELGGFGSTVRLEELFEVIPQRPLRGRLAADASPDVVDVRLLRGRDVQRDHVVRGDETIQVTAKPSDLLRAGDVVIRAINANHHGSGFIWSWLRPDDLPAVADASVIVMRPRHEADSIVVEFVLRYLASRVARDLAEVSQISGHLRLTARELADMIVPLPDQAVMFALRAVLHARDVAGQWRDDAHNALDTLFDGETVADSRETVLQVSRSLRLRVTAAEQAEDFAQQIRSTYPLPVAARWRVAHTTLSEGPTPDGYDALLNTAEVTLGYAANVGMALARSAGVGLSATAVIAAKLARGEGPGFGDWVAVLQELGGKKAQSVREATKADELCDFAEESRVAIARLRQRRNDEAHGRPVDRHDMADACASALADVELLLARSQFLADMPLILAGSTTWDALAQSGSCEIRRLAGDHPVVPRERLAVSRSDIENGSLYVQDSGGELHLLRPFVIAGDCPRCRALSTFHVDRVSNGVATLKSFEHGHLDEVPHFLPALSAVGLLPV
ncbi:restriction endonuclease subunit S domain-containing protein [Modestobacter caceresii]|uniref:hypothetical protein n=1 Tax=Modestobacter caceresii TaxID=1522368 RepID=UPI0018CF7740|nr:hypothetical protein [Modestobacter caceresii]